MVTKCKHLIYLQKAPQLSKKRREARLGHVYLNVVKECVGEVN
jgi:hypothetical protein